MGIGRGIAMLLSFIGFLLVARLLGPQQFGGFIFVFSLASLLVFLPNMGVDPYYSREVPAGRATAAQLLGLNLSLKFAGSLAFLLLYAACLFLLPLSLSVRQAGLFIAIAFVSLAFSQTWKTVLITASRGGLSGIIDSATAAFFLILVVALVAVDPSPPLAAAAFLLSQLLGTTLGFVLTIRAMELKKLYEAPIAYMTALKSTVPLMVIWFLSDLYLRVDASILYFLKGDMETGFYGASFRLVEGVLSGALVVSSIALPRLSRGWGVHIAQWRSEWRQTTQTLLALAVIPACLFTLLPDVLIRLFYGQEFGESARSLQVLGLATFALCFVQLAATGLTSVGQEYLQLKIAVGALCANVLLNLILIPPLGGIGAAVATLLSAGGYLIVAHRALMKIVAGREELVKVECVAG
jgi:O-antigen/teichoic acid export membrane protein